MHWKGQDAPYESRPADQKAYADAEHEPYRKAIDQPQQRGSEIVGETEGRSPQSLIETHAGVTCAQSASPVVGVGDKCR